eukprot:SAG11_NODE_12653_length_692_cov_1.419899_1_plen_25_part_01
MKPDRLGGAEGATRAEDRGQPGCTD